MVKKIIFLFCFLVPTLVLAQPGPNPLPVNAAKESTLVTKLSESDFDTKTGSLTETAPATDTASSGLNGRLQRIAQRLTTGLSTFLSETDFDTKVGSLTETAPATDTASSGLNGRLQRIAQRLTTLITGPIPASQSGTWNINNVSGTISLPTGASTETTLSTRLSESDFDTKTGSLTETAPATDTASSGVNGRLQRIAQRLTTILAGPIPASQSGTYTVQPGNTPNTVPWLFSATPITTGGYTTFHLVSAGSTNATNIKASAGQLYCWYIYNSNAAARKVALHNTAGTPTAGASVAISMVIPPSSGANACAPAGIPFNVGIGITMVTGLADSDATAVAANDLIVNLWYF